MDASKMNAPKIARKELAMQAYFGKQEWMQRHVAAGGVWGVGAQPLPILPGSAAERFPKEMSEKLSPLVGGVRGGGEPPQRGRIAEGVLY